MAYFRACCRLVGVPCHRPWPVQQIADEIERQLDAYEKAMERSPGFH